MLGKQSTTQQQEEFLPYYYVYLESQDVYTVILQNKIADEQQLELQDLISYVANIINEMTNFTIFLKVENFNQQSQTSGQLCQGSTKIHMYLRDFEQQLQNGYYIRFQLSRENSPQQIKVLLRKGNQLIKKLQSLKIGSLNSAENFMIIPQNG